MSFIYPFILTFFFSAILSKIVISSGDTLTWLNRQPTKDRWHKHATPSLGGVAMFVAFLISFFAFGPQDPGVVKVLAGGAIIFLLGLLDDLHPLPPYVKLIGQISVACLMVLMGVHLTVTGHPLLYIPLTLLWIVGITNAFNLLDNMDGLAGGIALIATGVLIFLTFQTASPLSPQLLGIFTGCILGFLVFNLHPAKLFMGDCGAQWLGFTLASFTILDTWQSATNFFILLATPALILAVPIFDTAFVTVHRKLHGLKVSQGGQDHTSHRLVAMGLGERKTVGMLWLLSLLLGCVAIVARRYQFETAALMVCGGIVLVLVVGMLLTDVKIYDTSDLPLPKRKRFMALSLFSKRRFVEILMDTILIGGSYSLAYLLRFDWKLDAFNLNLLAKTLPMVVGIKLTVMLLSGLYKGIWVYIDFENAERLFRSSLYASLTTIAAIIALYRFEGFSRTLFVIDFVLLFLLMGGTRALLRAFRESVLAFPDRGTRLLIIGAGEATRALLHDIRKHRNWELRPVLILDDDERKHGKKIMGIPIQGSRHRIQDLVSEHGIGKIVISVPSATEAQQTSLEQTAQESGLPWVNLPSTQELLLK